MKILFTLVTQFFSAALTFPWEVSDFRSSSAPGLLSWKCVPLTFAAPVSVDLSCSLSQASLPLLPICPIYKITKLL